MLAYSLRLHVELSTLDMVGEHRADEPEDNGMPHFAENANKGLTRGPPDS